VQDSFYAHVCASHIKQHSLQQWYHSQLAEVLQQFHQFITRLGGKDQVTPAWAEQPRDKYIVQLTAAGVLSMMSWTKADHVCKRDVSYQRRMHLLYYISGLIDLV
jgi:hypothetical protein